jgi:hypothetical protein
MKYLMMFGLLMGSVNGIWASAEEEATIQIQEFTEAPGYCKSEGLEFTTCYENKDEGSCRAQGCCAWIKL